MASLFFVTETVGSAASTGRANNNTGRVNRNNTRYSLGGSWTLWWVIRPKRHGRASENLYYPAPHERSQARSPCYANASQLHIEYHDLHFNFSRRSLYSSFSPRRAA